MTLTLFNDRTSTTGGLAGIVRDFYVVLEGFPTSILTLMFRIGIASVFFKSGLNKTSNWDLTVSLFADEYKLPLLPPELAAYLGTTAELVCPMLIALGLATRLGAAIPAGRRPPASLNFARFSSIHLK